MQSSDRRSHDRLRRRLPASVCALRSALCISVLAAAACLLNSAFCLSLSAQSPVSFEGLLRRVFDHVDRFEREFGAMVAEEHYDQRIASNAGTVRGDITRTLRSDFLLIKVEGHGWTPFRDVFEVDGRQLRDRQDRLSTLFLSGTSASAFDQARRIMDEGARYNLGGTVRNINVPTLPLMYFEADQRDRVRYVAGKRDRNSRIIEFEEIGHPTLIATANNRDLPANGRVWVDEATGAITRAELHASDPTIQSTVIVTFVRDDKVGSWVPQRMEDRIKRPNDLTEIRGVATYTHFRRFQVSTSEAIDTDQLDK